MEDMNLITSFNDAEILKLKTYLITGIQRELEEHPPVPVERKQVIERYLNQAHSPHK